VKEVLWSIPKIIRNSKEFSPFKRKLLSLVGLNFIVITIAAALFASYSMDIKALNFGKLHFSIIAISPVYISFNILEMLQDFIHGPFSPVQLESSAVHESDFNKGESEVNQVHTSRMDIFSEGSSLKMQDFEGSQQVENYSSGMHDSDFQDSSMGEADPRGRWFKGGRGKIWK
jgi:hypothetical protein